MWKVARRPQWIAGLILTLAVAAAFVLLSQWQVSRSIEHATVIERDTETAVALDTVATPQSGVTEVSDGQRVRVDASYVSGDFGLLEGRSNGGTAGYWVTGHASTTDDSALAIALGWAPTKDAAQSAIDILTKETPAPHELTGRYLATESPADDDFEHGQRSTMSVAALINEWVDPVDSVYGGYVVLDRAPAGLTKIDSPKPVTSVELNWLNVFYAIEWVVFAGFAIYLWWRFVRDAWEREEEEKAQLN